jgi:hypothetical protein
MYLDFVDNKSRNRGPNGNRSDSAAGCGLLLRFGILYPSVRSAGHCVICFRPALVYNPRPAAIA